jgi:hypothetical protein
MSRKSNKPVVAAFSTEFCNTLERVLAVKCKDGEAVPRRTVVRELLKDTRFGISNKTMLTLLVGLAVKSGGVPGYKSTRGRNGGIYSIAEVEALALRTKAEEKAAKAAAKADASLAMVQA